MTTRTPPSAPPPQPAADLARIEGMVRDLDSAYFAERREEYDAARAKVEAAVASLAGRAETLEKERDRQGNECAFHRYDALYAVKALLDAFAGGPTLNVTAAQGEAVERARAYVDGFGHLESLVTAARNAAVARAERAEAALAYARDVAEKCSLDHGHEDESQDCGHESFETCVENLAGVLARGPSAATETGAPRVCLHVNRDLRRTDREGEVICGACGKQIAPPHPEPSPPSGAATETKP